MPSILERRNRHTKRLPTRPVLFSVNVVFCKPRFDTNITVWIRPRFLSSRFEFVHERLPLGIAGGQPVLKYVSTDDMAELTMYSLPPVRIFPSVRDRETDMQGSVKLEDALVHVRVVPMVGDGFAVKTVHVLGDCFVDVAGVLEGGEGVVGGVRLCVSDGRIAEV